MAWKWWKAEVEERPLAAEAQARAQRAVHALPVLKEACAEVREALVDQIIQSGPGDQEARDYFYHAVKGLDAVVAMVEVYARRQSVAEAMDVFSERVRN